MSRVAERRSREDTAKREAGRRKREERGQGLVSHTEVLFATMTMPMSIAAPAGDLGLGLGLDLDLDLGKRNLSSLLPSTSASSLSSAAAAAAAAAAASSSSSSSARPSKRDCCYSSRSAAALAPANYSAAFPADASLWTCPTITTTAPAPAPPSPTHPPSHSRSNSALPPSPSPSPLARKARGSSPSATVDAVAGSTSATRHGGLGKHPRSSPSPSMSTHHDGFNPHAAADLLRQAMLSR